MADLLKPILDNGILSTNFFNGRLLMAEDLKTEQTANRKQHQELGRAIGDGIVYGFVVAPATGSPPPPQTTVSVTAGLAISRSGRAILLPQDVQVALVASTDTTTTGLDSCGRNTLFVECSPSPTASTGNPGLYLLTVMPTSGLSADLAPLAELGSGGVGTSCASKYSVEGVQFRMIPITPSGPKNSLRDQLSTLARQANLGSPGIFRLRNGLAHVCYGTDLLDGFAQRPFDTNQGQSPFVAFGLLDDMRTAKLISDCEVPIALLYWTTAGIRFIDLWSVRRRIAPRLLDDLWPLPLDARRLGDAESAFLQFQDQLAAISAEPNLSKATAATYFYYLPAAGFLPTGANQFTTGAFFTGFPTNDLTTDSSEVRLLLRESLYMDPIDPTHPPTVRLYTVNGTTGYIVYMRKPNWKRVFHLSTQRGAITLEIIVRGLSVDGAGPSTIQILAKPSVNKAQRIFTTFEGTTHRADPQKVGFNYSYDLGNLPFDTYAVTVSAKGYASLDSPQTFVINSQQRQVARFLLAPRATFSNRRPPASSKADWIAPGWYGKVYMVESQHKPTFPPAGSAAVQWRDVGDPPPETATWLLEWANYIGKSNPGARSAKSVRILVDPAHTPSQTPDQAYAYAVFDTGGSVPVLLTSVDQTLEHPMTVARAAVPGIDAAQDTPALQSFNIHNADALAAAYKSLVSHALNVSSTTAGALISSAQARTSSLAGSVSMFSGVDSNVAADLAHQNIRTAVDLANADPAKLASDTLSAPLAARIVDEARKSVPKDAWSLQSSALGLSQSAQVALQQQGITTLEAFRAAATARATQGTIATTLGIAVEQLQKAADLAAAIQASTISVRKTMAPATSLFGVGAATAVQLAQHGVGTAGKLAAADPKAIAVFFNGDIQRATDVITSAKSFIGSQT